MPQNLSTATPASLAAHRPTAASSAGPEVTDEARRPSGSPNRERSKRVATQNRPDIGDPQFEEWFHQQRGIRDQNRESVLNLCVASLILGARDLLDTRNTPSSKENREAAEYWVSHPMDTQIPFAFCCHMVGIRLPIEEAQRLYRENLVAIASMNMPNTGFPLEGD